MARRPWRSLYDCLRGRFNDTGLASVAVRSTHLYQGQPVTRAPPPAAYVLDTLDARDTGAAPRFLYARAIFRPEAVLVPADDGAAVTCPVMADVAIREADPDREIVKFWLRVVRAIVAASRLAERSGLSAAARMHHAGLSPA